MGYVTIGNRIDPTIGAERVVQNKSRGGSEGLAPVACWRPQLCGNIILLHDGGGERRETVRALPMIIDSLRARGYEIVPVYQLLGKTKADVDAAAPSNERWAARLNWVGFCFLTWGSRPLRGSSSWATF